MGDLVDSETLARRLRMHMGADKVSRLRLAASTNISRPSLANKLDGQVQFTYDELRRIVAALGLDWRQLISK